MSPLGTRTRRKLERKLKLSGASFARGDFFPGGLLPGDTFGREEFWPGGIFVWEGFCPGGGLLSGGLLAEGTFARGAYARSPQVQCVYAPFRLSVPSIVA